MANERGVRTYGSAKELTPAQQEELKEKQARVRAEARAEAEAKEAALPGASLAKAQVEIESVALHPSTREVSVHGTVDGKAAAARFTEADLMTMETVAERQRYVAGHLKVVAQVDAPEPPEHLAIVGSVRL